MESARNADGPITGVSGRMSWNNITPIEVLMSDDHVDKFDHLFEAYTMLGLVPIDGWATADLVKLAQAIDVELQQRGEEAQGG